MRFCVGMKFSYSPWRKRMYWNMWVDCDEDNNIAANRDEMTKCWLHVAESWLRKCSRSGGKTVLPLFEAKTFKILTSEPFFVSYHRCMQIIYKDKWNKRSSLYCIFGRNANYVTVHNFPDSIRIKCLWFGLQPPFHSLFQRLILTAANFRRMLFTCQECVNWSAPQHAAFLQHSERLSLERFRQLVKYSVAHRVPTALNCHLPKMSQFWHPLITIIVPPCWFVLLSMKQPC